MARHSEEECAYCEGDILPLSYIVGEDDELYCSIKCADAGEKRWREQPPALSSTREVRANLSLT